MWRASSNGAASGGWRLGRRRPSGSAAASPPDVFVFALPLREPERAAPSARAAALALCPAATWRPARDATKSRSGSSARGATSTRWTASTARRWRTRCEGSTARWPSCSSTTAARCMRTSRCGGWGGGWGAIGEGAVGAAEWAGHDSGEMQERSSGAIVHSAGPGRRRTLQQWGWRGQSLGEQQQQPLPCTGCTSGGACKAHPAAPASALPPASHSSPTCSPRGWRAGLGMSR